MGEYESYIKQNAAYTHFNHGRIAVFNRDHKGDQHACDEGCSPHDRYCVGAQSFGDDSVSLKVGDQPAGDAGFCSVLAKEKAGNDPEFLAFEKTAVSQPLFFCGFCFYRSETERQPHEKAEQG